MTQHRCPYCKWILSSGDLPSCPICGGELQSANDDELETSDETNHEFHNEFDDTTPSELGYNNANIGDDSVANPDHAGTMVFPDATDSSLQKENLTSTLSFGTTTEEPDALSEPHGTIFLLFSPFGRIGRLGYLLGYLLLFCSITVTALLDSCNTPPESEEVLPLTMVAFGVVVLCAWMITVKRFHDFGWSGWSIVGLGLMVGALWMPIIGFIGGYRGRNKYGYATRLIWDVKSIVLTAGLSIAGVYSAVVFAFEGIVDSEYSAAWASYEANDFDTAFPHMKSVIADTKTAQTLCPFQKLFAAKEMYATWVCAEIYARRQDWDSSVEWHKKSQQIAESLIDSVCLPEIESELRNIRIGLVNALENSGNVDEAIAILDMLKLENKDDLTIQVYEFTAVRMKGFSSLENQEYKEAQKAFSELIDLQLTRLESTPDDQELRSNLGGDYHNLALALQRDGNFAGAMEDVLKAIELQEVAYESSHDVPQYSQYLANHYSLKANLHRDAGDLQQAVEAAEKAIAADPENSEYRGQAALLRYTRHEYPQVVTVLDTYLENRNDAELEYLLAVCLLFQDQDEQAARVVERRRSQHADDLPGRFLTGVIAMKKDDYQSAIDAFEAAESFDSGNAAVLFSLARCKLLTGQKSDAEEILPIVEASAPVLAQILRAFIEEKDADPKNLPLILDLYNFPTQFLQPELPAGVNAAPRGRSIYFTSADRRAGDVSPVTYL